MIAQIRAVRDDAGFSLGFSVTLPGETQTRMFATLRAALTFVNHYHTMIEKSPKESK